MRPADQSIIATQRGDIVLTPTNNPPKLCSTSSQPWTDLVTIYDLVVDTALAVALCRDGLLLLEDTLQHNSKGDRING